METQRGYEPPNPELQMDLKKLKILGLERKRDAIGAELRALDVNDAASAPTAERLKKDFDAVGVELDQLRARTTGGELRRSLDRLKMGKEAVGQKDRPAV